MKTVTVQELKAMIDNNEDFQLIDVREPYEAEICSINGTLIPLSEDETVLLVSPFDIIQIW